MHLLRSTQDRDLIKLQYLRIPSDSPAYKGIDNTVNAKLGELEVNFNRYLSFLSFDIFSKWKKPSFYFLFRTTIASLLQWGDQLSKTLTDASPKDEEDEETKEDKDKDEEEEKSKKQIEVTFHCFCA
jgi:hypothetical protein